MGKFIDLTGQKFGRLTVVKRVENDKQGRAKWLCKCDCGNIQIIQASKLRNGHSKSCGCLRIDTLTANAAKRHRHKLSNTKLYQVWANMKDRCLNPNCKNYKNYGGNGIKICAEWLISDNFLEWAIANGYKEGLTIDRIDNNKGYSPDNCRWTTFAEQENNKSNNHFITYKDRKQTLQQWADELKISRNTLLARINRDWTIERALTEEVHSN